jgi:hypothetical protein
MERKVSFTAQNLSKYKGAERVHSVYCKELYHVNNLPFRVFLQAYPSKEASPAKVGIFLESKMSDVTLAK